MNPLNSDKGKVKHIRSYSSDSFQNFDFKPLGTFYSGNYSGNRLNKFYDHKPLKHLGKTNIWINNIT